MPKLEPMQQPPSRTTGRRARAMRVSTSLAEINVVPLIDVMLVLLVIFMVAAPMMQQGFAVQLPQSRRSAAIKAEPITVTVPATFRRDRRVQINNETISVDVLHERMRQALSGRLTQAVILAADGTVPYQDVIVVMDKLREGGVTSVGMQTQPPVGRKLP